MTMFRFQPRQSRPHRRPALLRHVALGIAGVVRSTHDHERFACPVLQAGTEEPAVHVQTAEDTGVLFEDGEGGRPAEGVPEHGGVGCVEAGGRKVGDEAMGEGFVGKLVEHEADVLSAGFDGGVARFVLVLSRLVSPKVSGCSTREIRRGIGRRRRRTVHRS